mmetsp:Transcript_132812/g.314772  ORF Transcript_132812/g.314772 Transcript_132812/m.314772 type:complete len:317 (+) Transcript_132812:709-1659(+)
MTQANAKDALNKRLQTEARDLVILFVVGFGLLGRLVLERVLQLVLLVLFPSEEEIHSRLHKVHDPLQLLVAEGTVQVGVQEHQSSIKLLVLAGEAKLFASLAQLPETQVPVARAIELGEEILDSPPMRLHVVPQWHEVVESDLLQLSHLRLILHEEVAGSVLLGLSLLHGLHDNVQLHVVKGAIAIRVDELKELLHFLQTRRGAGDGGAQASLQAHEADAFHQLLGVDLPVPALVELAEEIFRSHLPRAHVICKGGQDREASLLQLRHVLKALVDPGGLGRHLGRVPGLVGGHEILLRLLDLPHLDPKLLQSRSHH